MLFSSSLSSSFRTSISFVSMWNFELRIVRIVTEMANHLIAIIHFDFPFDHNVKMVIGDEKRESESDSITLPLKNGRNCYVLCMQRLMFDGCVCW